MSAQVTDLVVDFYYAMFDRIFSQPFGRLIAERLKRDGPEKGQNDLSYCSDFFFFFSSSD